MAYGYFHRGLAAKRAVFHLFFRRAPFQGGFTVAAGLEAVIDFIDQFHFSEDDLAYLRDLKTDSGAPFFSSDFLDMLQNLEMNISLDAVEEGTVVFPYEPLLRVEGPLILCQLLESPLLNLINFPTLIATKAARVSLAAKGDQVLEFGLRRAQGIDGALTASRAAFIGGCTSTSNVLAGKVFDIPVKGTQAHSWVMVFGDEEESFKEYARVFPDASLFLVDTYDTLEGVKKACRVGQWLKEQGKKLVGIRLDSGDLAYLSIESRKLLDEAGLEDAVIVASNELDEYVISELKQQGATITVWGVGTNLVTGRSSPALDGVYKLSAIEGEKGWQYALKLSEQLTKISNPGILAVRRFYKDGKAIGDVIWDRELGIDSSCMGRDAFDMTKSYQYEECQSKDLLVPIFQEGKRVYKKPTLQEIQNRTKRELSTFSAGIKRFLNPHLYPVSLEDKLHKLKTEKITQLRKK